MKQEKASSKALKHVLYCIVILVIFVVAITVNVDAETNNEEPTTPDVEEIVPLRKQFGNRYRDLLNYKVVKYTALKFDKPRIIIKDINYYINQNYNTLLFFAKAFGYDMDFIKDDLISRSSNTKNIEPTNIASLKKEGKIMQYPNVEYGIVEYFLDLVENNSELRKNYKIPYNGSSDYVEKLIMYYTNIYTSVDRVLALSIGAAESGYYEVKYMLNRNNVYGGMGNNGLIVYDNIEIGVLKYIRLLYDSYFNKGLTDVYSIGRVYCPTYDEYGNKVASSHWISLVNKAKNKYENYTQNITIDDIVNY